MTSSHELTPGVSIENLSLSYGNTEILKGVNLSIAEGEFFTFLGPSGSGKSTLLRAIAGFGPKPKGRIIIRGKNIAQQPPWKRDLGMVFQSYALWPHMTVRKNVAFGLEQRKLSRREINTRVDTALDMVGLRNLADRRPSQLSGGQQQRIALARTIVIEPKVLLLDEPLSNLDASLRVQLRREIRELQKKLRLTTIFVTHDQEEANTISDRMAVLNAGTIQQVGTPMELYDYPANLFVAKFLGTANVIQGAITVRDGRSLFTTSTGEEFPVSPASSPASGIRHLVFRPQNVSLVALDQTTDNSEFVLRCRIKYKEFLGNIIRYGVDVGKEMILIDDPHRSGQQLFNIGDNASIRLDQEQLILLN